MLSPYPYMRSKSSTFFESWKVKDSILTAPLKLTICLYQWLGSGRSKARIVNADCLILRSAAQYVGELEGLREVRLMAPTCPSLKLIAFL